MNLFIMQTRQEKAVWTEDQEERLVQGTVNGRLFIGAVTPSANSVGPQIPSVQVACERRAFVDD